MTLALADRLNAPVTSLREAETALADANAAFEQAMRRGDANAMMMAGFRRDAARRDVSKWDQIIEDLTRGKE